MNHIDPHHLTCRDAVELVTDYVEGALSPEDLLSFEEHVVLCEGCCSHLENLRRIRRATRRAPVQELDAGLFHKLAGVLRMQPNPA
ncbi:MAG: zf-HC2 domain-containing protein [Minicystis sp.]